MCTELITKWYIYLCQHKALISNLTQGLCKNNPTEANLLGSTWRLLFRKDNPQVKLPNFIQPSTCDGRILWMTAVKNTGVLVNLRYEVKTASCFEIVAHFFEVYWTECKAKRAAFGIISLRSASLSSDLLRRHHDPSFSIVTLTYLNSSIVTLIYLPSNNWLIVTQTCLSLPDAWNFSLLTLTLSHACASELPILAVSTYDY